MGDPLFRENFSPYKLGLNLRPRPINVVLLFLIILRTNAPINVNPVGGGGGVRARGGDLTNFKIF